MKREKKEKAAAKKRKRDEAKAAKRAEKERKVGAVLAGPGWELELGGRAAVGR